MQLTFLVSGGLHSDNKAVFQVPLIRCRFAFILHRDLSYARLCALNKWCTFSTKSLCYIILRLVKCLERFHDISPRSSSYFCNILGKSMVSIGRITHSPRLKRAIKKYWRLYWIQTLKISTGSNAEIIHLVH